MSVDDGAIVLVHGAWGGSYGFHRVRPLLWAAGRSVFTPSLTGIGERSHLAHPGIALSTHVTDVVNTVLYEDLDDIVLVGFSYGGMVVTGALDHIGDRVRHLVYLDAFVPEPGQSVDDLWGRGLRRPAELEPTWQIPPLARTLDDPAVTDWFNARRSMQPVGTLTEPVALSQPVDAGPFTRTYIKATADPGETADSAFWRFAHHAQASPAWQYHEIATHHLIALERPDELAAILLALDH